MYATYITSTVATSENNNDLIQYIHPTSNYLVHDQLTTIPSVNSQLSSPTLIPTMILPDRNLSTSPTLTSTNPSTSSGTFTPFAKKRR